ncbi:MAG: cupin domain-containing protein [Aquisalimonadaceae bacterium]
MSNRSMSDEKERRALTEELATLNCRVAHPDDPPLFTKNPQTTMVPCHWRAADVARMLDKIGASLKLEAGGQRRTLRLANPGLPYGTTPTFWTSIQYILPGEVATNHRHAATALRFIMQGSGTDTIVDGEQYIMNEGDLVLTPQWAWHDHEHKGDAPMIWIDVLDISLVRALHATFFEGAKQPRQTPAAVPDRSYREYGSGIMRPLKTTHSGPSSPVLAYTWERAEAALWQAAGLEPDPHDDIALEYQNPLTGDSALPTIGTVLQMLRPGVHCKPHRHTGSVVYYVVRGQGSTIIDGQRFDWARGDFLSLPPWAVHEHMNRSSTDEAVMFQVNDIPALKKLGLYREEAVE